LNLDPPDLCLQSGWDYSSEHRCPSAKLTTIVQTSFGILPLNWVLGLEPTMRIRGEVREEPRSQVRVALESPYGKAKAVER
jgi:hypothetical protein